MHMVRKCNKRNRRSNKGRAGCPTRQLHQASTMRLCCAPVSADPPVRPLMHELSAVIRISQLQGTTSEVTSNGGLGSLATVNKAGHDLVVVFAGYKSDTSFELCEDSLLLATHTTG
ncbi:hypothetical protein WA026_007562 [Henosepilachna vigintioctopunctata]|uniref:Uncharacterized protein n=1 Tax=Henosepilachna vigintioctopunctata TaxID=420089 RepID=A0AAW1UXI8_9CUCU